MAGLPSNNAVESWAPEPELREAPPRRTELRPSEYPDLNQPSKLLYMGVGGGVLVGGLILLIVGLVKHNHPLVIVLGIILAIVGAIVVGLYPAKVRSHLARAEHLVSFGVPVIARILSADNLTGDSTYARAVKYQVVMPGGEMAHKTCNADERLLPSRVPGDATALMDISTSDVELYCALPLRAGEKLAAVSRIPTAATPIYTPPIDMTPAYNPSAAAASSAPTAPQSPATLPDVPLAPSTGGGMGSLPTLGGGRVEPPARPAPVAEPAPAPEPPATPAPAEKPAAKPGTSSGLPWE